MASAFNLGFQIEEAGSDDLEQVHLWFNPNSHRANWRPNPNVTNFVAKRKSRIIGFVQLVYHPPKHHPFIGYWLFSLNVRLKYRGLGIGDALSQAVMERAEGKGASKVLRWFIKDSEPAIRLYHKLGFRERTIPGLDLKLEEEHRTTSRRRTVLGATLAKEQHRA